jgi:hypothetical protein
MNREQIYKHLFDKLQFIEKQYLTSDNEDISNIFLNELIDFHKEFFKGHNKKVKYFFYKHKDEEKYKDYIEYSSYQKDYFLDTIDEQFTSCYIGHLGNMRLEKISEINQSEKLVTFNKFKIYIDSLNYLIYKFN